MNKKEFEDQAYKNGQEAMDECERAYKQYLDERQRLYSDILPESTEPERNYANEESLRAFNNYLNIRKKAWDTAQNKNRELKKKLLEDEIYVN
jgi:hypothetical protein